MVEIKNSYHLSNLIGIKWEDFKSILNSIDNQYHNFFLRQKNGKKRKISSPSLELSKCQKFILKNILEDIHISKRAYGFVEGRNHIKCAKNHIGSIYAVNVDIKDFFLSISEKRVYYIFNEVCKYNNIVSTILTKLTTYRGSLPQGALTSPCLTNVIFYKTDCMLARLSKQYSLKYTRYVDDITFSSYEVLPENILGLINNIIENAGFELNQKKIKIYNNGVLNILGLLVKNNGVYIHKNYIKKIRQELYYIEKYGIESHIERLKQNGIRNINYKEHLLGKINYINQISKDDAKMLYEKYNQVLEMKNN